MPDRVDADVPYFSPCGECDPDTQPVPEAPEDGNCYVRIDGQWVETCCDGGCPPTDGLCYVMQDGAWVETCCDPLCAPNNGDGKCYVMQDGLWVETCCDPLCPPEDGLCYVMKDGLWVETCCDNGTCDTLEADIDLWVSDPLQVGDDFTSVRFALDYLDTLNIPSEFDAVIHVRPGTYPLLGIEEYWGTHTDGDNITIRGEGSVPSDVIFDLPDDFKGVRIDVNSIGRIERVKFSYTGGTTARNALRVSAGGFVELFNIEVQGKIFHAITSANSAHIRMALVVVDGIDNTIAGHIGVLCFGSSLSLYDCTVRNCYTGLEVHNAGTMRISSPDLYPEWGLTPVGTEVEFCNVGVKAVNGAVFSANTNQLTVRDIVDVGAYAIRHSTIFLNGSVVDTPSVGGPDHVPTINTEGTGAARANDLGSWVFDAGAFVP